MVESHQVRGLKTPLTHPPSTHARGVRCCWRLSYLQVPRVAVVRCRVRVWTPRGTHTHSREKGDASRARDFLPADKQYLITRNGALIPPASIQVEHTHSYQSHASDEQRQSTTPTKTRTLKSCSPSLTRCAVLQMKRRGWRADSRPKRRLDQMAKEAMTTGSRRISGGVGAVCADMGAATHGRSAKTRTHR